MSAKEVIFVHVARVRWRMRVRAALQGCVLGLLAVGAALVAGGTWVVWQGVPDLGRAGSVVSAVAVVLVLGTGIWRAVGRIDSLSCARALDLAIDSATRNADRTAVAVELAGAAGTPFVDAALDDAASRLDVSSARRSVPYKRPPRAGLAVGMTIFGAALMAVAEQKPSFLGHQVGPAVDKRGSDASERIRSVHGVLKEVHAQAKKRGDRETETLAALAIGLLNQAGELGPEATKARLGALLERSDSKAVAGGRVGELFESLARLLEKDPSTMLAAEAVRRFDAETIRQRFEELAARLHQAPAAAREEAAAKFAEAARLGEDAPPRQSAGEKGDDPGSAGRADPERELKRLERALDEASEDCEKDPDACATSVKKAGDELAAQAAQAEEDQERGRVNQALKDAIEQITGEQKKTRPEGRGTEARSGAGETAGSSSTSQGGAARSASSQTSAAPTGAKAVEQQAGLVPRMVGADRAGRDPGDAPLGKKTPALGQGGKDERVDLPTGEGQTRAQVIAGGATGQVQGHLYQRVFRDYAAIVEETLDTTAVPAQRRDIVRRYFDLIGPRAEGNKDP